MSNDVRPFAPFYNRSQYVNGAIQQTGTCPASTTVAASNGVAVASAAFSGSVPNPSIQMRISNKTSVWVHVNFGVLTGAQAVRAAALTDFAVAPGSVEIMTVDPEVNACSVFADGAPSASTSVIFTRGSGA